MLLALDAGNSNITIGAFEGRRSRLHWRLRTVHEQTADEWGILLRNLFSPAGLDIAKVDGIIISSVVPPIDSTLASMTERYFHTAGHVRHAAHRSRPHHPLRQPQRSGRRSPGERRRRLLQIRRPVRGRAISAPPSTSTCISRDAEYLGGAIAVGIGISIDALFSKTARLPMVDFRPPKDVIGTNTVASMQSGLYYGAIGMIDGILERIIAKLGPETKAIATGGQAHMIVEGSRYLKIVDEHLTLEGLQMIWERNRK